MKMTERTIEAARVALVITREHMDSDPDAIMAWNRLKNFIDLAEKELLRK